MAREFLIPGWGYINAEAQRTYLIPGWGYFNDAETNTFNDPISESITCANTLSSVATANPSAASSITVLSDVTGGLVYAEGLTETLMPGDSNSGGLALPFSISDQVTLGNSLLAGNGFFDTFTESVNPDGVRIATVFYSAAYGDALYGRSEYADAGLVSGTIVQTDALGLGYITVSVDVPVSVSEAITPADALALGISFNFAFSQGVTAADALRLLTDFGGEVHARRLGSFSLTRHMVGTPN